MREKRAEDIYNLIIDALLDKDNYSGSKYWATYSNEIRCENEYDANSVADFLECVGFDCVNTWYDEHENCWVIYPKGM